MRPRRMLPAACLALALAASIQAGPPSAASAPVRALVGYADRVPSDERLSALGLRVLYRFESVPAVAVLGPREALRSMAGLRGVVSVEEDRPLRYLLETADFATNAADVWGSAWWPVPEEVRRKPALSAAGEPVDGRGVTIGVVDSGINALHPDLWYAPAWVPGMPWEPKVLACVNVAVADGADSQPYCDETVGHGTHVAGIAAGNAWAVRNGVGLGNPRKPYLGAAPGAKLVGAGMGAYNRLVNTAAGLDFMWRTAELYGIRVVTNSWGDTPECSVPVRLELGEFANNTVYRITNRLIEKDVSVLFAAGNYSGGATWTSTYARNATPGVVAVANYTDGNTGSRTNRISASSSDGCTSGSDEAEDLVWTWPDVAAPGTSITSTASYTGLLVPALGGMYTTASGTSMATPMVAGIVALMYQANPALTPAQVERILVETATPWDDNVVARQRIGSRDGWGAANAAAAAFVDRDACRVTPADAADPASSRFPRFDQIPAPDLYVCRDFKRGNGLVDAYAAVRRALELRPAG